MFSIRKFLIMTAVFGFMSQLRFHETVTNRACYYPNPIPLWKWVNLHLKIAHAQMIMCRLPIPTLWQSLFLVCAEPLWLKFLLWVWLICNGEHLATKWWLSVSFRFLKPREGERKRLNVPLTLFFMCFGGRYRRTSAIGLSFRCIYHTKNNI